MEAGLEGRDQREFREPGVEHPHGFAVRRVVRGHDAGICLHGIKDGVVHAMHARKPPRVDRLETDGATSPSSAMTPNSGEVS